MADVTFSPFSFSSTSIEFFAKSEAARAAFADMFGAGAVSVEIRKSAGPSFEDRLSGLGLSLQAA